MLATLLALAIAGMGAAAPKSSDLITPPPVDVPTVEVAICLDTSGSMDALIDSARQKIWTIVNDLSTAEPAPTLRFAVISFGNLGHSAENGWVSIECPLTEDLDRVSESLFSLKTNGGDEYVARAVRRALRDLEWSDTPQALRMVIVAGNESANQDPNFKTADVCALAAERGVVVNPLYCTYATDAADVSAGWREVATLTEGHYAAIDPKNGTIVIASPFDDKLVTLSSELNGTYVPYGEAGKAAAENQVAQDANALGMNGAAAAGRCVAKAGSFYNCGSWDLVDAIKNGTKELDDVDPKQLPKAMQELTSEELAAQIDALALARKSIQEKILGLEKQRQEFLAREMLARANAGERSFDIEIRKAMRDQAKRAGLRFPTPLPAAPKPTEPIGPMPGPEAPAPKPQLPKDDGC